MCIKSCGNPIKKNNIKNFIISKSLTKGITTTHTQIYEIINYKKKLNIYHYINKKEYKIIS